MSISTGAGAAPPGFWLSWVAAMSWVVATCVIFPVVNLSGMPPGQPIQCTLKFDWGGVEDTLIPEGGMILNCLSKAWSNGLSFAMAKSKRASARKPLRMMSSRRQGNSSTLRKLESLWLARHRGHTVRSRGLATGPVPQACRLGS